MIHEVQLDRALDAGADAVLLIVRILENGELPGLVREAEARGLVPLVEVATEEELDRALDAGARARRRQRARPRTRSKMDAERAARVLAAHRRGRRWPCTSPASRGPEDVAAWRRAGRTRR